MPFRIIDGCIYDGDVRISCQNKGARNGYAAPLPAGTPVTNPVPEPPETAPGGVEAGHPSDVPEPDTGDTATADSVDSVGGGNNYGSLTTPSKATTPVASNLTTRASKYALRSVYGKGAAPTLSKLPIQGVYAAELNNVGYDLVEKYGQSGKVPSAEFAKSIRYHTTPGTKQFAGELLEKYSDTNIQIYRRTDGHITAVTRGTATIKEVRFDARNIALLDNAAGTGLFEDRYYSVLRAVKEEYGKPVDVIMGHSLGGHVAISATDRGLAQRSVSLNPYVRPSSVGAGDHLILRTPTDPALLSAANITSGQSTSQAIDRMGPNTTMHVIPESTGVSRSLNPLNRLKGRVKSHSTYNFQPEHSRLPVEEVDSFLPSVSESEALLVKTDTRLDEAMPSSRLTKVGSTASRMAKGGGANIVGAIVTDQLLDVVGVDNEYVKDAAAGVGGAVVESAVLGTAFSEAGPAGLFGGIGVAEADYLADRTGVEGAGKVALEVGGGMLNTALGATAITQFWNPLGMAAALLLAAEGAAVGIDAAIQAPKLAEEEEKKHEQLRVINQQRMVVAKERGMDREDYMRKIGRDSAIKMVTAPARAPAQGGPVAAVRQVEMGGPRGL